MSALFSVPTVMRGMTGLLSGIGGKAMASRCLLANHGRAPRDLAAPVPIPGRSRGPPRAAWSKPAVTRARARPRSVMLPALPGSFGWSVRGVVSVVIHLAMGSDVRIARSPSPASARHRLSARQLRGVGGSIHSRTRCPCSASSRVRSASRALMSAISCSLGTLGKGHLEPGQELRGPRPRGLPAGRWDGPRVHHLVGSPDSQWHRGEHVLELHLIGGGEQPERAPLARPQRRSPQAQQVALRGQLAGASRLPGPSLLHQLIRVPSGISVVIVTRYSIAWPPELSSVPTESASQPILPFSLPPRAR